MGSSSLSHRLPVALCLKRDSLQLPLFTGKNCVRVYCRLLENLCACKQVRKRQGDLLNYIVFLRVTPLLPNTFINVCGPIVRVPLPHFALGAALRTPFSSCYVQ